MDVPASPEDINRRLAEISKELWELDESDFRAKYELQRERDVLRDRVRSTVDMDADRSTDDLLAELRARQESLEKIRDPMVSSAGMSGGGGANTGSYEGPADGVRLNTEIVAATGANQLAQRIARLESILVARGAL